MKVHASTTYRFGEFELQTEGPSLTRNGRPVAAEPKVLEVLAYLAANSHRIVAKSELLDSIWKDLSVVDGVVHRCVSQARRLVGDGSRERRIISTRGRRGYQFLAPVSAARTAHEGRSDTRQMVGRQEEFRVIESLVEDLTSRRRGKILCVAGSAGSGKTRLLEALTNEAATRGARVLHAPCREVSGAAPLRPWVQVLQDIARGDDGSDLLRRLGPRAAHLPDLALPEINFSSARSPETVLSAGIERSRFFASAELLIRLAAEASPTAIVIDDLHCADESTLALWHMLAQSCARVPLVLACAYREEEARRRDILRTIDAEAFSNDHTARLGLGGLSREETELLVAPLLDPGTGLAARIHERSEGNPFFALELARHVAGREGEVETFLPNGIKAVAALRLDALGAAARSVLRTASVVGREIDLATLRAVSSEPAHEIDASLDEAASAGIVERVDVPGRYRFRHILLRDVLYDEIPQTARRRCHRAVADHLRSLGAAAGDDRSDELAYHYLEAAPDGGVDEAVQFAVAAAEHATGRFAFEAAARSYERASIALSLAARTSERRICVLDIERADSWSRAGDDGKSKAAYREAARRAANLGDADLLARAAIGLTARFGQPVDFGSSVSEARDFLHQALAALPDEPTPRRAVVLACLAFSSFGSGERTQAASYAARSERDARACGDGYATCVALVARHFAALEPGNPTRAAVIADELIATAEKCEIPEMVLAGQTFRVFRCLEESTGAMLDAALAARRETAKRWPGPQAVWWSHTLDATTAMMRGDWKRGDELSRMARRIASRSENANLDLAFRTQQSQVLLHRGDFAAALEISRESARQYPHLRAGVAACHALMAALGERTEAAAFAREWKGKNLAGSLETSNWLFEASCLVELAFRLRNLELSAMLLEFLEPHRDRNVIVGQGIAYNGPVARMLGLSCEVLGRYDEAVRHFEHARERAELFGALPWDARVRMDEARVRRMRNGPGDTERSARLLVRAGDLAARTGSAGLQIELALM
jgi:DNA-binding winged helix-turn-helix (wHTH) protein/tetratricopeptide (TPR) repeat protein